MYDEIFFLKGIPVRLLPRASGNRKDLKCVRRRRRHRRRPSVSIEVHLILVLLTLSKNLLSTLLYFLHYYINTVMFYYVNTVQNITYSGNTVQYITVVWSIT